MAGNALYGLMAMFVVVAYLQIFSDHVKNKEEIEAIGAFKSYLPQARQAGNIGNQPPDPSKIALPEGYSIAVSGDYVELRNASGVVRSEKWR